jgi:hypothetical protein
MILPWSAAGRYIRHLEEEIAFLRSLLGYKPPEAIPEPSRPKADRPPDRLLQLVARFETQGPALLEECRKAHAGGLGWEVIIDRIEHDLERQRAERGASWESENGLR